MPRPLILYVSTVADVERWFALLKETGFKSIAKIHGGTLNKDNVVKKWTAGDLDIVVGNLHLA